MREKNSLKDPPKKRSKPTPPPGILNGFTQDDLSILVGSARLHGFGALNDILTLPYWPPPAAPDLYRPVASILLAAQYAIGGGSPIVFRIVSIAL